MGRVARRYQGSQEDRDVAYGMEIVYFDLINLLACTVVGLCEKSETKKGEDR
jgi:hypothetical protein